MAREAAAAAAAAPLAGLYSSGVVGPLPVPRGVDVPLCVAGVRGCRWRSAATPTAGDMATGAPLGTVMPSGVMVAPPRGTSWRAVTVDAAVVEVALRAGTDRPGARAVAAAVAAATAAAVALAVASDTAAFAAAAAAGMPPRRCEYELAPSPGAAAGK